MKHVLIITCLLTGLLSCKKSEDPAPASNNATAVDKAMGLYANSYIHTTFYSDGDSIKDSQQDTLSLKRDPVNRDKIYVCYANIPMFYGEQIALIDGGFTFQIPMQYSDALETDLKGVSSYTAGGKSCSAYCLNGAVYIKTDMLTNIPDVKMVYEWELRR